MKPACILCVLAALLAGAHAARAADANMYGLTGTSSTGAPLWQALGTANPLPTTPGASSASTVGLASVVSGAAESSHVFKASAGNLYDAYVTIGSTAGFLMIFNLASAPADGAVTPQDCLQVPASTTQSLFTAGTPPEVFTTGITAVFSTTGCFTKTASATAFFHGRVK